MDETMIHVSDRSVGRFDPIRSWSTNGAAIGRYSRIMAEAERLRQSLLADAGRGDLLKTTIERVELRSACMRAASQPIVHFVGGIPLPDTETVFCTLTAAAGPHLLCLAFPSRACSRLS